MPGSFIPMGGCLFTLLAWAGIFLGILTTIIGSAISLLFKKKFFGVLVRIILWLLPVVAGFYITSNYLYLFEVRQELITSKSVGREISHSVIDTFRYLPPYEYQGYYRRGFPTTTEANIEVRELRVTMVILLIAGIAALYQAISRRRSANRDDDRVFRIASTPEIILGAGGFLAIVTHLIFVII